MTIQKLFDVDDLWWHVENGYVAKQVHPHLPLVILNYTPKTAYDHHWNAVTLHCRGLVVHNDGRVIANCLPKFFNHDEPLSVGIVRDGPVQVTDKLDGSYLSVSMYEKQLIVNTRGSFESEQAQVAREIIAENPAYETALRAMCTESTAIFEVIYPANRIVLDYGAIRDIVFIGIISTHELANGRQLWTPANKLNWPGKSVESFNYSSYTEAISQPPRDNKEGMVVYFENTGDRLKIKQADYIALHRIITNCTARRLWTHVVVNKFQELINKPSHWGSYLRVDPTEAIEILEAGDDWLSKMLLGVPDEFYNWVHTKITGFNEQANAMMHSVQNEYRYLLEQADGDRKTFAGLAKNSNNKDLMFYLLDNKQQALELEIWKRIMPEHEMPFKDPVDID